MTVLEPYPILILRGEVTKGFFFLRRLIPKRIKKRAKTFFIFSFLRQISKKKVKHVRKICLYSFSMRFYDSDQHNEGGQAP